jgi:branched-chain amino acid transport system substrate-binding protein
MKPAGFENGQGIMVAQYRKDATDAQWSSAPDYLAWKEFMTKYQPSVDLKDAGAVYGYAVTHTMVEVLKLAGDNLTRENIMKQAANLKNLETPMLLPGIKINTSATDFYPIQAVRLARFKGETWELFGDIISSESE